jgi:hypothetical protein
MMSKIKKWFNSKVAMLSLAMSNVEKNMLGQTNEPLSSDVTQVQRHTQGQLADSLVHGEVTQEVMDLRWRTYKIIRETEGVKSDIVGYDKDGMPIVKTRKINKKLGLNKVNLEPSDNYPLEMVLDNSEISLGGNQAMDNDNISVFDEVVKNYNDNGDLVSITHGKIDGVEYFASNKSEVPLKIIRTSPPKFKLESYTKKLNVRKIDEEKRLLEFFVSKYVDEYNRTSRLFLSDLKKAINEPDKSTILDFQKVNFISYKTMGVDDFLEFEYEILSYDKIVEFNGFYVVKFIAKVIKNGDDILDTYRMKDLDKKYEQKSKK